MAQIFSVCTIMLCVLTYIQIGFYDAHEVEVFARHFAIYLLLIIAGVIFALIASVTAINLRYFLLFDGLVWKVVLACTAALAIPVLLAYPLMDFRLRAVRHAAVLHTERLDQARLRFGDPAAPADTPSAVTG